MKVLFVTRSLGLGGAERQMVVLAQALAARGHQIAVALFYPDGPLAAELEAGGIPLHSLAKRGRWDLFGPLVRLMALLRRLRPDIVHGYLPVANILAAAACALTRGSRLVFGIRASDMDLSRYDATSRWTYRIEAWLARRADLVIANSTGGLAALWRRGAVRGRGIVLANGIDTTRFRPDPASRAAWRQRLEIGETALLVGMVARRDPMKDHAGFLAAAARMAATRPDLAFVLAGTGVSGDDPILAAQAAAVAAPVHLLGPLGEIEGLMAALDIAVLASCFGEGFPNVLAEAMACGVPCVATDVGSSAAIVGGTGRVVPPGDAAALAEACLGLAGRLGPDLERRCRAEVESRWSVPILADKTEAALAALTRPLLVHVITGLGTGGAELMLARLVRTSHGFRHIVVSLTDEGSLGAGLREDGLEVVALGLRPGPAALVGLPRLALLLRRLRPALVQTWLYHADLIGLLAARLAGCRRVAWSLRCSDMDQGRYGWLVRLLARLSHLPVAVLANSQAGLRWHQAHSYRPKRWEVVANGIDTARFRPDAEARTRWRKRLGIGEATVLVGMVARCDPMKDHRGFLAAAAMAAERGAEIAVVLAGRGTETLAGLAPTMAAPLHLLGEIDDTAGLNAALDIAVLASRFGEGFPNVVAEAMACGLSCVASDVGDAAALMGEAGISVPVGDQMALAEAIAGLAGDGERRQALGAAARQRIVGEFGLAGAVARFESVWGELITDGEH